MAFSCSLTVERLTRTWRPALKANYDAELAFSHSCFVVVVVEAVVATTVVVATVVVVALVVPAAQLWWW